LKNLKLKAIVVVALAFMVFSATAAFADGIDVSAVGGTYTFGGNIGDVFSTTNLGSGGVSVHQTSPVPGAPFNLGSADTISFTTGLYLGGGLFGSGGSISYSNALCGGVCFSGSTNSSQLLGSTILASFTTNFVNPAFAALVGANFGGGAPNATGSLSLVLDPSNNTIGSADYTLVTPEPASLLMLGGGLLAIGGSIRRKLNLI
jgi:hypothetical protein